ncbi:NINJA-FAMILY PROTEIN AFP1 [Salix viminalis]|uniref:Ninja-family protein n=1 Tax=Salix viminalis TaxID=40686 RepID=A0A9Q0Z4C4_SALVM|nr:NINJA-FAMILY PROTEIN AFP1 [Salix viminalis]
MHVADRFCDLINALQPDQAVAAKHEVLRVINPLQERSSQEAVGSSGTKKTGNACRASRTETENLSKKLDSAENGGREIGTNAMEDMPCVFTKGDGPNGRRVDGILYKYGKGEGSKDNVRMPRQLSLPRRVRDACRRQRC